MFICIYFIDAFFLPFYGELMTGVITPGQITNFKILDFVDVDRIDFNTHLMTKKENCAYVLEPHLCLLKAQAAVRNLSPMTKEQIKQK